MKLNKLRNEMQALGIAAFIIPTSDPHKSEYISDFWKTREWLTGFKGSSGTAVVTQKHAGLWTDSRYFIIAENQLENPFKLHKLKTRTPEYIEWITQELDLGDIVGVDGQLFSVNEIEHLTNELAKKGITLKFINDVFLRIWENRPTISDSKAFSHPLSFAIESRAEKIAKIRSYITHRSSTHLLISTLDEIAWLLNIRGNDIPYNPLLLAYCMVSLHNTTLFIDPKKIEADLTSEFMSNGITIRPYEDVYQSVEELRNSDTLIIDKNSLNYELFKKIPVNCSTLTDAGYVTNLKSIKNYQQVSLYKEAQIADGIAMCKFLFWLTNEVKLRPVSEFEAGEKATFYRSKQPNFMGISFEPISAYQANAASPHYSSSKEHLSFLEPKGIYLIDSGGQYLGGTTDITRTVALGEVTQEQKTDFTLVLKGHIRLASAKFPKGTKGIHLDTLTRLDLWQHTKNFDHGSGHGIGYFLNVHEGPQGFSQSLLGTATVAFEPGMLVTNEPGFYLEGSHGIRTENVMVCKQVKTNITTDFLEFETLTYCPIDKSLLDTSLLTTDELFWLNQYHLRVYELISPSLNGEELLWLKKQTEPI